MSLGEVAAVRVDECVGLYILTERRVHLCRRQRGYRGVDAGREIEASIEIELLHQRRGDARVLRPRELPLLQHRVLRPGDLVVGKTVTYGARQLVAKRGPELAEILGRKNGKHADRRIRLEARRFERA